MMRLLGSPASPFVRKARVLIAEAGIEDVPFVEVAASPLGGDDGLNAANPLGKIPALTRDDVLVGLDESDADFAKDVRKAIFTFANIPARISTRDIPGILRGIDQADLLIALGGAQAAGMQVSANYILENMSVRMADQLRDEIQEAPEPKTADVQAAMGRVIGVIRQMAAAGDLIFISEEE
jgi:flagellar motor switch protein FliG